MIIGVTICLADVTAFKSNEPDVAESAHRLFDALPLAVYTTDAEGRITYYNQAAADFWGRRPELYRETWCGSLKLFHPGDNPNSRVVTITMAMLNKRTLTSR